MRNRYWRIKPDSLDTALSYGKTDSLFPHENVHYALQGNYYIVQANYTDEEIDELYSKNWATPHGKYEEGFNATYKNLFLNFDFSNGDTNWILGTGYSVQDNEYLEWDSDADSTVLTYQDLTVPINTILKFTFDYQCVLDDETIVTAGTAFGSLNNARVQIFDVDENEVLGEVYIGETQGEWEKRSFLFSSPIKNIRFRIMGRRKGNAKFKNFICKEFIPHDSTYQAKELNLPSFKGGNWGNMINATGGDISDRWLTTGGYTAANKAEWIKGLTDKFLANGLNVCRLFIYMGGNFDTNPHMLNDDWSALKNTEAENLADFMENVVPEGIKIIPVIESHTFPPDSIINTSLTPTNAHETQDNYFARVSELLDILLPYKEKIATWEIMNEPNLVIGTNDITWKHVRDFLARFYTLIKTKDTTVPVSVSHQNQTVYMYHDLLIDGTCDFISMHFYGTSPIKNDNTLLAVIPDSMRIPCTMGEGRHINGHNELENNAIYLREANNIYYALGFEGFYPWTIKGVGGEAGSSDQDIEWTEEIGKAYVANEL